MACEWREQVRETGDHGPINSWDRVPYVTRLDNGSHVAVPRPIHVRENFIINGYNGVWTLDHDDGSRQVPFPGLCARP